MAGIEQAEDGSHHLTDAIETDAWNQKAVARDATLEVAERTSAPRTTDVLALTNISWADDADQAADDLSLVDARFDKSVLEVAIATFLEEWAMNDGSLDFTAVRTPNRTVLRTASVRGIEVRDLVSREPIAFRVAVAAHGIYYEVDRRTEEVVAGDPRAESDGAVPLHAAPGRRVRARVDGHGGRALQLIPLTAQARADRTIRPSGSVGSARTRAARSSLRSAAPSDATYAGPGPWPPRNGCQ